MTIYKNAIKSRLTVELDGVFAHNVIYSVDELIVLYPEEQPPVQLWGFEKLILQSVVVHAEQPEHNLSLPEIIATVSRLHETQ